MRRWDQQPRKMRHDTIARIREDVRALRDGWRDPSDAVLLAAADGYEALAKFLDDVEAANVVRVAGFVRKPDVAVLGSDE